MTMARRSDCRRSVLRVHSAENVVACVWQVPLSSQALLPCPLAVGIESGQLCVTTACRSDGRRFVLRVHSGGVLWLARPH